MNRNQVEGGVKDAAGKVQRKLGRMVGSDRQEASGVETQAEGKTQKTAGDVTNAVDRATDKVKDAFKK
ncbi:MAG TPA: CsbD family protein [Noviherbaspirillum sp.]|uniref:CsbD family protein n=1 Tax=Noviherbaspirillum sp. TaxID=1926288 RepID=UPI002D5CFD4D|nr:CsbD family protein [Noviherbaspirillum sp.]HYD94695.1 CsbD family protein [Noviherbaspirillum sp.]